MRSRQYDVTFDVRQFEREQVDDDVRRALCDPPQRAFLSALSESGRVGKTFLHDESVKSCLFAVTEAPAGRVSRLPGPKRGVGDGGKLGGAFPFWRRVGGLPPSSPWPACRGACGAGTCQRPTASAPSPRPSAAQAMASAGTAWIASRCRAPCLGLGWGRRPLPVLRSATRENLDSRIRGGGVVSGLVA